MNIFHLPITESSLLLSTPCSVRRFNTTPRVVSFMKMKVKYFWIFYLGKLCISLPGETMEAFAESHFHDDKIELEEVRGD